MGGEEDTEKKKTKKKNNSSTNYEVDQSYSFKDLVVSQPSWTLFGGGGGEGEDKAGGDVEEKTLNKIERPSSSSSSSSSDEEEQRVAKATRATKPSSSSFEIKPKPAKRSLRETLLPFDESEMKRKSRAWQLPAFSSSKAAAAGRKRRKSATEKNDDHGDKDKEAKETHRRTLAEWHQTVDKFRDDYKAKRKAAVRRSKRG